MTSGKLLPRQQTLSQSIKTNVYNLIVVINEKLCSSLWTCILKPILEFLRQLSLRGTYLHKTSLLKSMTLEKSIPKRKIFRN